MESAGRATLTELARAAGLPSSTAARLLDTLEQARFVRRASDGAYTYGTKLLQLGVAAVHQLPLYEVAIPHLERLVQQTGETANLAIADGGGSALYLNSIPSPRTIRHATWIGRTVPLEGTAVGAALLGRAGLGGYAVAHAAVEPDVSAMAAAILGPLGSIVGALSVTAPSYRIGDDDVEAIGRVVAREAEAVGAELGAAAQPSSRPDEAQ